jgi:hypothetical protein
MRYRAGFGACVRPWMQRSTNGCEQVAYLIEVCVVVDVATIGRATPCDHDPGATELCQVVRDEVLGLVKQLDQLANPSVAASEFDDQLPAHWLCENGQDLWRANRHAGKRINLC